MEGWKGLRGMAESAFELRLRGITGSPGQQRPSDFVNRSQNALPKRVLLEVHSGADVRLFTLGGQEDERDGDRLCIGTNPDHASAISQSQLCRPRFHSPL